MTVFVPCRERREPPTLENIISRVIDELTRRQNFGSCRYIYAPHLADLGEQLKSIYELRKLRPEVMNFAVMMSFVMNMKGAEIDTRNLYEELRALETQFNRLREIPTPTGDNLRRILIHIANYAMLAEMRIKS